MSAQSLLLELKKYLPLKVYGKGPVIELLREMGKFVDKKTPLRVTDMFRSQESGEIVCTLTFEDRQQTTAALTNLKLDITHPLYRKVKNYRIEVAEAISSPEQDVNRPSFRVGSLYKKS